MMMNMIKAELFRWGKAKGTFTTLLFVLIFSLLLFAMSASFGEKSEAGELDQDNALYTEVSEQEMEDIKSGGSIGFVAMDFTRDSNVPFDRLLHSFLSSGVFLIFSGIFAVNTVCDQYKSGFQKNLSVYADKKWQPVLAKHASVLLFVITELALVTLSLLLLSLLYFRKFCTGGMGHILSYLGMQLLLHDAFAALLLCLTELVRGKVAGITVTCLLSLGVGNVMLAQLDRLLHWQTFALTEHTLVWQVKLLPLAFDAKAWKTAAAVAIFFLVLYHAVSVLAVSRRDMA